MMLRADVAYALVRAVSRHFSTHGRVQHFSRRRDESRRGTHECARHIDGMAGFQWLGDAPDNNFEWMVSRWFERI